jgi:hypothetical protein
MLKHWIASFGVLGAIVGIVIAIAVNMQQSVFHDDIHYHAGFLVYVNNQLQDFSDLKYMKLTPCGQHEDELTPAQEQLEKAHLHDSNGDVVHVHRDGATWGDLFTNMEYALPEGVNVAYVNGERFEGDISTYGIHADDSVVIFVGTNDDIETKLEEAVTLERIRVVEGQSEDCGSDK